RGCAPVKIFPAFPFCRFSFNPLFYFVQQGFAKKQNRPGIILYHLYFYFALLFARPTLLGGAFLPRPFLHFIYAPPL
ncbi:MAG: hypothetical protein ACK5L3_00615, partial [Oscillospiraceae bacterium]